VRIGAELGFEVVDSGSGLKRAVIIGGKRTGDRFGDTKRGVRSS
jgi:hypothetical protein